MSAEGAVARLTRGWALAMVGRADPEALPALALRVGQQLEFRLARGADASELGELVDRAGEWGVSVLPATLDEHRPGGAV